MPPSLGRGPREEVPERGLRAHPAASASSQLRADLSKVFLLQEACSIVHHTAGQRASELGDTMSSIQTEVL